MSDTFGRHCLNHFCDGPEWWDLFEESIEEYKSCPNCGYPCKIEHSFRDFTENEIMYNLLEKIK